MKELSDMTNDEIISTIEKINTTKPQTINGARGASIYFKELHDELDKRDYGEERPSRKFSPPSMRRGS